MNDSTHQCPAPECTRAVSLVWQFACLAHWRTIPREKQARLTRLWAREPGSDEYFEARADCLRALGVNEGDVADLNGGIS